MPREKCAIFPVGILDPSVTWLEIVDPESFELQ